MLKLHPLLVTLLILSCLIASLLFALYIDWNINNTNRNNRHHRLKFNHKSKTKKELMRNINRSMPIKNNWCPCHYYYTQSKGSNKRQTQIEKPRFWIRNFTKNQSHEFKNAHYGKFFFFLSNYCSQIQIKLKYINPNLSNQMTKHKNQVMA